MPARRYVEENGLAAMHAAKRSVGITPEVSLRECVKYTHLPSANNTATSGFETQWRYHQNSKTGVLVARQKGLRSSKNFKKIESTTSRNPILPSLVYVSEVHRYSVFFSNS